MNDLHIVIVGWNTEKLVLNAVNSLAQACDGLSWSCTIVDNNSKDQSIASWSKAWQNQENIEIIPNSHNVGFAKACNQGARDHKSRYILLLNPDTECPPNSLFNLVKVFDQKQHVKIMGPRLVYADGKYQESVRRFPGVLDQIMILLKLHHFFPQAKCLQRYFMKDLEISKPQEVDQVMGACFMVKSDFWQQIQGLDERYFIWFEEVDFCKIAKTMGFKVWYEPTVEVVHHGGQSFAQVFSLKKQAFFNTSLKKYMLKWRGRFVWLVFFLLSPISLFLAWIVGVFKKNK